MSWAVEWTTRQGPQIEIHCPRCNAAPAIADTEERVERLLLLGLIPVLKKRTTFAVCSNCGAKLQSKLRLDELAGHTPAQLQPFLARPVAMPVVVLVVVSLLMAGLPCVGVVFALLCVLLTISSPGWPRFLAWTSLLVSMTVTAVLFVPLLLAVLRARDHAEAMREPNRFAPPGAHQPAHKGGPGVAPGVPDGRAAWPPDALPALPDLWPAGDEAVPQALSQLKSGNPAFKHLGLMRLAQLPAEEDRRQEVTAVLLQVLSGGDPFTRAAALRALAVWHTPEAVERMIESASDPDWSVRLAAFEALARLRDPRAAEAVARRLPNMQDRAAASRALTAMGAVAEAAVLEYTDHGDSMVCVHACRILETIGTEESLGKLVPLSQGGDFPVRTRAERAVRAIRSRIGS